VTCQIDSGNLQVYTAFDCHCVLHFGDGLAWQESQLVALALCNSAGKARTVTARVSGQVRSGAEKDQRMAAMEVRFKLEKETKGALRYQEVDEKGEVIEQAWAKIGTLYVRKSAFERGAAFPPELRVTLDTAG